jgi:hypothetical protein
MGFPNKYNPEEKAALIATFSQDTFIVDYLLDEICDKIRFKNFDDRAYWLDVRAEWDKIKENDN